MKKQGDDGWEIVDDLKNIRLPAKQLEDEEEKKGKRKEKMIKTQSRIRRRRNKVAVESDEEDTRD